MNRHAGLAKLQGERLQPTPIRIRRLGANGSAAGRGHTKGSTSDIRELGRRILQMASNGVEERKGSRTPQAEIDVNAARDVARGHAESAAEGATHVGGIGEPCGMGRLREARAGDEVTRRPLKAEPANVRPHCDAELLPEDVLEARG
jgi:hypothetical protein